MSFADIGVKTASVTYVGRERTTTDALRKFQDECKSLSLQLSMQTGPVIHEQIEKATLAAKKAKDVLADFWIQAQKEEGNEFRKQNLMYKKFHKDFQAQCKLFESIGRDALSEGGRVSSPAAATSGDESNNLLMQDTIMFNREDTILREKELQNLHTNVVQVNSMFRDLAVLVEEQTEDINDIESNILNVAETTDAALAELVKSNLNKRKISPIACWLLIILVVVALVIVFVKRH